MIELSRRLVTRLPLQVDDDVDQPGAKRPAGLVLLLVVLHVILLLTERCVDEYRGDADAAPARRESPP
jgi:hypothetical protein